MYDVSVSYTISYIPCLRVALAEVAWERFCALGGHRSGRGRLHRNFLHKPIVYGTELQLYSTETPYTVNMLSDVATPYTYSLHYFILR